MAFDYSIFKQALGAFDFGLGGALTGILLILVSAIIITRDTRNLRLLLFPLSVGFYQIGIFEGTRFIPYTIIAFTAVVWIVTLTGAHIIGSTLSGAGEAMANLSRTIIRSPYETAKWGAKKYKASERYEIKSKQAKRDRAFRVEDMLVDPKAVAERKVFNKLNKSKSPIVKMQEILRGRTMSSRIAETKKLNKKEAMAKMFKANPHLKGEMSKLRQYMIDQGFSKEEAYNYVGRQLMFEPFLSENKKNK